MSPVLKIVWPFAVMHVLANVVMALMYLSHHSVAWYFADERVVSTVLLIVGGNAYVGMFTATGAFITLIITHPG